MSIGESNERTICRSEKTEEEFLLAEMARLTYTYASLYTKVKKNL